MTILSNADLEKKIKAYYLILISSLKPLCCGETYYRRYYHPVLLQPQTSSKELSRQNRELSLKQKR